jgi:hypothetical protein
MKKGGGILKPDRFHRPSSYMKPLPSTYWQAYVPSCDPCATAVVAKRIDDRVIRTFLSIQYFLVSAMDVRSPKQGNEAMKLVTLLAVTLTVVGVAYCLQHGVFVGSEIVYDCGYYKKKCDYLFADGRHSIYLGGDYTIEEAKAYMPCSLFLR